MSSEIEQLFTRVVSAARLSLRRYDRGVVAGVVLASIPIFPACFFGMLLSLVNIILLRIGRLDRANGILAVVGVFVGFVLSFAWLHILLSFDGAAVINSLKYLLIDILTLEGDRGIDALTYKGGYI